METEAGGAHPVSVNNSLFFYGSFSILGYKHTVTGGCIVQSPVTTLVCSCLARGFERLAMIAHSRALSDVRKLIDRIAPSSCTVLIQGESGTGKELAARAIHDASPRKNCPFIPLNVSAIPPDLVESYLFGHERGAFTGASDARLGVFRSATGGTVLLDEIGEMPIHLQAKLLRTLEQKEVMPVGVDAPMPVDARVIASTNLDLARQVAGGKFRKDLFYRLDVVSIHIPPLRERVEDIPPLTEYFCRKYSDEQGRRTPLIEAETMQRLMNYSWAGNVRELAHVVERAVLLCEGDTLNVDILPPDIRYLSPRTGGTLEDALESCKRMNVIAALQHCNGHRAEAAQRLGISQATLFRYIDHFGLKGIRFH